MGLRDEAEYQLKEQMKALRVKLKEMLESKMKIKGQVESSLKVKEQTPHDLFLNLDCLHKKRSAELEAKEAELGRKESELSEMVLRHLKKLNQ